MFICVLRASRIQIRLNYVDLPCSTMYGKRNYPYHVWRTGLWLAASRHLSEAQTSMFFPLTKFPSLVNSIIDT